MSALSCIPFKSHSVLKSQRIRWILMGSEVWNVFVFICISDAFFHFPILCATFSYYWGYFALMQYFRQSTALRNDGLVVWRASNPFSLSEGSSNSPSTEKSDSNELVSQATSFGCFEKRRSYRFCVVASSCMTATFNQVVGLAETYSQTFIPFNG